MWWQHCCHSNFDHRQGNSYAPLSPRSLFSVSRFIFFSTYVFLLFLLCSCSKWYPFSALWFVMVSSPHQYPWTAGRVCNQFFSARDKDLDLLCVNCRSKECSADDHYGDCYDWDDDMWQKVSDYCTKLWAQEEREKKKKKAKATSSTSSLSEFSPSMPFLLCDLPCSFDSGLCYSLCIIAYHNLGIKFLAWGYTQVCLPVFFFPHVSIFTQGSLSKSVASRSLLIVIWSSFNNNNSNNNDNNNNKGYCNIYFCM